MRKRVSNLYFGNQVKEKFKMIVMEEYEFYDNDICRVDADYRNETLRLSLSFSNDRAIFLSKEEIVAMAKIFDLLVFDSSMAL